MKRLNSLLIFALVAGTTIAQAKPDLDKINGIFGVGNDNEQYVTLRKSQLKLKRDLEPNLTKRAAYDQEMKCLTNRDTGHNIDSIKTPYLKYEELVDNKWVKVVKNYESVRVIRKAVTGKFNPDTADVASYKRRLEYLLEKDKLNKTRYYFDWMPGSGGNYYADLDTWFGNSEPIKTNNIEMLRGLYLAASKAKRTIQQEEDNLKNTPDGKLLFKIK